MIRAHHRLINLAWIALAVLFSAGCRDLGIDMPDPGPQHVAAGGCFACRDRETLKQALDARVNDREAFARMRSSSKIVPVGKNEKIKLLGTAEDGKYAKVRLKKDPNDFWMLAEWVKVPEKK